VVHSKLQQPLSPLTVTRVREVRYEYCSSTVNRSAGRSERTTNTNQHSSLLPSFCVGKEEGQSEKEVGNCVIVLGNAYTYRTVYCIIIITHAKFSRAETGLCTLYSYPEENKTQSLLFCSCFTVCTVGK
jgi:hypothetical protein